MQPGRTWASLPRFPLLARVFQWGRSGPTSGSFASLALHPRGLRAICLGTEIGPRYGCSTCKKTCAAHAHWVRSLDFNFLIEIRVFSTNPPKSYTLFAGGALQQPRFLRRCAGGIARFPGSFVRLGSFQAFAELRPHSQNWLQVLKSAQHGSWGWRFGLALGDMAIF